MSHTQGLLSAWQVVGGGSRWVSPNGSQMPKLENEGLQLQRLAHRKHSKRKLLSGIECWALARDSGQPHRSESILHSWRWPSPVSVFQGSGCMVLGSGFRVPVSWFLTQDSWFRIQDPGSKTRA